jgi:hypothetical protein
VLYSNPAKKLTEATLSYLVQFSKGFTWAAGGNLPGIGAEHALSETKERPSAQTARLAHLTQFGLSTASASWLLCTSWPPGLVRQSRRLHVPLELREVALRMRLRICF